MCLCLWLNAPPKSDVPIIELDMLNGADGLIFSFPTHLTPLIMQAHHGMIYVPIGYTFDHCMFEMEEEKGGSPYGAVTYAGDGTRQVSEIELLQAFH
ncbi:putative NAD(P)H dehydrogenase (quinone) FQR1-like [Arachis hypogaea]|nr:putative NAD(P)H dehydrogenase (quinone) FQR1-like [Arachis hypogaea]